MTFFHDDDLETTELVPLDHAPARPPREEHPERAFANMWRRLMELPGVQREVFAPLGRPLDQRAATAAASFACWLGTNCGAAFLLNARRCAEVLVPTGKSPEMAYVMAWACENGRCAWVNSGVRLVESLLCRQEPFLSGSFSIARPNWPAIEDAAVNLLDIDAIDCVVQWLPSVRGHQFLAACEAAARTENNLTAMLLAKVDSA